MADIEPTVEVLENQVMRAWMKRDASDIKALVAGDCIFMFGTTPPVILDRPSLIAGMNGRFACKGFRFNEVTARKHGKTVWFTGHVELELLLGRQEWRGSFLISDLWRKTPLRRNWKLAERSLSPLDKDSRLSDTIRSLQLWR